MQKTVTPDEWATMIADANESAGDRAEPDWAIAPVAGSKPEALWRWYVALPMGDIDGADVVPFVAHKGAAMSRKSASRAIAKHIAAYDAAELGINPQARTMAEASTGTLRMGAGMLISLGLLAVGASGWLTFWVAAAIVGVSAAALVLARRGVIV